jgi:DNA-binding transcriptional LysR family regulator
VRIEQLEYIAAVTRYGSLRRAAEELHISQPALSEAVGKLERELGVPLLDRRRSGARISRQGRELLPSMLEVLDSVQRLRGAAGDQLAGARMVRAGTVNAGTPAILFPAAADVRRELPGTAVEIVTTQSADIHQGLIEGGLDLGLVNVLPGDDIPQDLRALELLSGHPVVCCRTDSPLAERDAVSVDELGRQPLVAMRAGYLMHRFVARLYDGDPPAPSYSTDGAEMGKLMVADGLGVTVLPDYSIDDDPLVRAGLITHRPIAGVSTVVRLLLLQRRSGHSTAAVGVLAAAIRNRAAAFQQTRTRQKGLRFDGQLSEEVAAAGAP